MSMFRMLSASVVLCGLLGGVARGQTLQEALSQAYANNPTLQTARAQLRVVDENVPQALSGWRPSVTIAGSAGYNSGTARSRGFYADQDRQIASAQATVRQPV